MIWDLHVHLSGLSGKTPKERINQMLPIMDRMGIDRICLYLGMNWVQDPTPEQFRKANDEMLAAREGHEDRVVVFAYLNPKHLKESLDEIEARIAHGPFVGVKLWVAHRAHKPELDPIIERCAQLKAVIFQHTWIKVMENYVGESTPMQFAELAARHPGVPMICGHTGGDWELGIRAISHLPHVSVDLAGSDTVNGFTEMAVRELGPERIIYGSDAGGRSFATQLAKVHGADIPESAKKRILGENLKRMLTPIMTAKGMKI
jgi:hypothetical protein